MSFPFPPLDGSATKNQKFPAAPDMGIDPTKRYTATMETSMGTLVIALDPIRAPKTVNSFVYLAGYHYYDGIIFHRIIKGFVCQGGDPTGTGRGGSSALGARARSWSCARRTRTSTWASSSARAAARSPSTPR